MTIIIETPAPPTRERLVLVPPESCEPVREVGTGRLLGLSIRTEHARDATPADLERAGYVLEAAGAEHIRAILVAAERPLLARAEKAERELSEVRELQRSDERDGNVGFSLTCWVESILEQLNIARINRTELGKAAGRYARERDEAKELARVLEVERDTLRAEVARLAASTEGSEPTDEMPPPDNSRILSSGLTEAVEVDLMGIVDTAIGRMDSYGASLVCRGSASGVAHTVALDAYRLGVAHERARQQPAQDRATDEELYGLFNSTTMAFPVRAGVLAVAARVRQERCLIAQAVDAHMSTHVYRRGPDDWAVALGPRFVECEPADVPATLARLLGEVAR